LLLRYLKKIFYNSVAELRLNTNQSATDQAAIVTEARNIFYPFFSGYRR
jgi:hypothetical protein